LIRDQAPSHDSLVDGFGRKYSRAAEHFIADRKENSTARATVAASGHCKACRRSHHSPLRGSQALGHSGCGYCQRTAWKLPLATDGSWPEGALRLQVAHLPSSLVTVNFLCDLGDDIILGQMKFHVAGMLRENGYLASLWSNDSESRVEAMRHTGESNLDGLRQREVSGAQSPRKQLSFRALELRGNFASPIAQHFFPRT
jgi:hypothetical protein